MSDELTLVVDADVPMMPLFEALTEIGLRVSKEPGTDYTFRVRRRDGCAKVTSLADRRRRDAATDRQMRDGMRALHGMPTDPDTA